MAIEVGGSASHGDGVHRAAPLPALTGAQRATRSEDAARAEMVRVTEAAALASARFMGRGEKDEADAAATEAMRRTMDDMECAGQHRDRRRRTRRGADAVHWRGRRAA